MSGRIEKKKKKNLRDRSSLVIATVLACFFCRPDYADILIVFDSFAELLGRLRRLFNSTITSARRPKWPDLGLGCCWHANFADLEIRLYEFELI